MYIVTGGTGFIGSNIDNKGIYNIIVVDNLKNGNKYKNISSSNIQHYVDKDDFMIDKCNAIESSKYSLDDLIEKKIIRYQEFPDVLKGKYQSFTKANINKLRVYYFDSFHTLNQGIKKYIKYLKRTYK